MRKIIDLQMVLSSVVMVILDYLAYVLTTKIGLPSWLCALSAWGPSTLGGDLISKGVYASCRKFGKELTSIAIAFLLVFGSYALLTYGGVNVWQSLPFYIIFGIIPAAVKSFVTARKIRSSTEQILKRYGTGKDGLIVDRDAAAKDMQKLIGTNKGIGGSYRKTNAVTCENGIFVGKEHDDVLAFKGIPFAVMPEGSLRWKKPEPPKPSENVYQAFYYGKSAPQPYSNSTLASLYDMGEDCLTLNVWKSTEADDSDKKMPVLVWINTYDWCVGGTACPFNDGDAFVKENPDVLFVNMNFRLGILGNMDFSEIPGGENYPDSMNLGLQDQIEALRWINRNIAAFGGDPKNITIIGNAGGATAVILLSLIAEAKGLFSKAVVLGGSIYETGSLSENEIYRKEVADYFHANSMDDFLALRSEELADAVYRIQNRNGALPVRDGKLVPADLLQAVREGAAAGISMIIVNGMQESNYPGFVSGGKENLQNAYKASIDRMVSSISEEQQECLDRYISKHYSGPEEEIDYSELATDLFIHYPMLRLCHENKEAGGKVRYLVWDLESPLEEVRATSTFEKAVLLGKEEYHETLAVVGDPIDFKVAQQMLVNFIKTGDSSLEYGDVEGTDDVKWPAMGKGPCRVMTVNPDGYTLDDGKFAKKIEELTPLHSALLNV